MENKVIYCKECYHLGYDINRSSGLKVPMCNCFPIYRIIENILKQPKWCPIKNKKIE